MSLNLSFEKINPNDEFQARAFMNWYNDPVMIDNWTLQKEEETVINYTLEDFKNQFAEKEGAPEKYTFMVKLDGDYIGYGQFYINHMMCMTKAERVCWPSIAIGNSEFRGKGFGLLICKEILRKAELMNCTHIEAGVFEFNKRMKSLLVENGFSLIGRQERKTFVENKWWASEHYLLELVP